VSGKVNVEEAGMKTPLKSERSSSAEIVANGDALKCGRPSGGEVASQRDWTLPCRKRRRGRFTAIRATSACRTWPAPVTIDNGNGNRSAGPAGA